MMEITAHLKGIGPAYLELCKPKVVLLMLVTSTVGMQLATPFLLSFSSFFWGNLGIGLIASAGGTLNHFVERKNDELMGRTKKRPLPLGKISPPKALSFALILIFLGTLALLYGANELTTVLTLASLIGYAGIYTFFLKPNTPQNIVIGGLAGAMPPLLGWTVITHHIDPNSLLLVLIIFTWTPPHFWCLALARQEEYALAKIPMLSVTHGTSFTKIYVLLYVFLLSASSVLPFACGLSGLFYFYSAIVLNIGFLYQAIQLIKKENLKNAMPTFHYSNFYLLSLFVCLLIDHFVKGNH